MTDRRALLAAVPRRRALLIALAGLAGVGAAAGTGTGAGAGAGAGTVRPADGRALLAAAARAGRGTRIELDPGTVYTLPATLALTGRGVVLDGRGAVLRLADDAERVSDRLLDLGGRGSTVRGVRFAPRPTRADASPASWAVQITGTGNAVEDCVSTTRSRVAIGVAGGSGNRIAGNRVTGGGGLRYAWAEARGTRCTGNTVLHARGDAIGGVGNGRRIARGHVVDGNTIRWCRRIGIEDWGAIAGTRIVGNRIRDVRLMGISAVGGRTVIERNVLVDAGTEWGVETSASGVRLTGNALSWGAGAAGRGTVTGVIVNGRWSRGGGAAYSGLASAGNTVTGAGTGLDLHGDLPGVVSVDDAFRDCRLRAINAAPDSADSIRIERADIRFDVPSHAGIDLRDGVVVGVAGVVVEASTIRFGPGSAGPAQDAYVRQPVRARVVRCTFDDGGRTDPNRPRG